MQNKIWVSALQIKLLMETKFSIITTLLETKLDDNCQMDLDGKINEWADA